jgi:predicted metal-dependent peptidase
LAEVKADIDMFGIEGGGGTSFVPVFDRIHEDGIQPDMLVYLTDTYGSFPAQEPDYKVIWGSIVPNPRVPFGQVVEVEID